LKLLVLDNGSETTDKLAGFLQKKTVVDVEKPVKPAQTGNYAGIILSGGALPREGYKEILSWYKSFLNSTRVPILGVCLGLRIIGYCHGARIRRMESAEKGVVKLTFHGECTLAPGRRDLEVYEDHDYELVQLPESLENYGSTATCRVQVVKHKLKSLFGVQFHPEVDGGNEGSIILKTFTDLCAKNGD